MTHIEVDTLRLRYKAAFDAYHLHAVRVVEHSKGGAAPPKHELDAEEQALWELARIRSELLNALNRGYRRAN